ncbi:hypothetical protein C5472_10235 [Photorhabdus sp. RW14-46]|nr:hypothetical protein [Photorhabdus sp. RW14-46]
MIPFYRKMRIITMPLFSSNSCCKKSSCKICNFFLNKDGRNKLLLLIPVIFQVASLLAALTHPGHIVCYAPGDSLPCRRDAS